MSDLANRPDDKIIARLFPVGRDAERTFSQIVDSIHLTEHHKQFVHAVPYEGSLTGSPATSDYQSDQPPRRRRNASPDKLWDGHYLLSTERPGDVKPSIGWRVGRGTAKLTNRGVDFLVICPDEHFYDVAVVHALIQIHPESGVLMLRGVSDTRPVNYYLDKTISLYSKDKHVLFQRENRFSLGKLDFNLVYEALDDVQYADRITIRNRGLEQAGKEVPSPRILAIPRKAHVKVDDLILHDNISSGAFGLVCAAVEASTGVPVAMKETWIKHKHMLQDKSLKIEREVSTEFKDAEGLLQAHTVRCQHGVSHPCGAFPERFYMTFPLALHDFSIHKWSQTSLPTILALLKGPLEGLKTLHEAGYMHRDVSAKNLLVMSLVPPRAVLCDYGKARHAPWHVDSHIGPIPTLAPEVDGHARYDNKIDIWGIGYVCCGILFPSFQRKFLLRNNSGRPDRSWHIGIMALLSEYQSSGPTESSFADLVRQMLAWTPRHRASAAEALRHPCIQAISASPIANSSESQERSGKLQKLRHDAPNEAKNDPASGRASPEQQQDHSGDTEILTPGRRPLSFDDSALGAKAAATLAEAKALAAYKARPPWAAM